MQRYGELRYDLNAPSLVSACDELPLWPAPFGLHLLDTVRLKYVHASDRECGTGFPLLELAERLGTFCRVFGIDLRDAAIVRLQLTLIGHRCALIHTDLFSKVVQYTALDPSFRATMKYTPTLTVSRHSILIHLFQKATTTPIVNPTEDCHTLLSQACLFPILKICVHSVGYFHIQRNPSVSCSKREFL